MRNVISYCLYRARVSPNLIKTTEYKDIKSLSLSTGVLYVLIPNRILAQESDLNAFLRILKALTRYKLV